MSPLSEYQVGSGPVWKKLVPSSDSSAISSRIPITSLSLLQINPVNSAISESKSNETYCLLAAAMSHGI